MDVKSIQFIVQEVEVHFDTPPMYEKSPPCPDEFAWQGRAYRVTEKIAEWADFTRRGRYTRNMRPTHATVAAGRGSLGVGRFHFQVRTDSGQVFELYYDREIKDVDDRLGHWFLYRELALGETDET